MFDSYACPWSRMYTLFIKLPYVHILSIFVKFFVPLIPNVFQTSSLLAIMLIAMNVLQIYQMGLLFIFHD